jgi:ketosteroid isomerase-like protein
MVTGTGKVTIETLQRLVDAFNAHDLDAVMSFFTDDPVLELPRGPHPWGRRFQGWAEVRAGLASRFAGIPDVHYGEDRHWVSGDRGCSEWLLTGTTTQGERIEVRGCDLFEFRGDKTARKDSHLEARRAVTRCRDDTQPSAVHLRVTCRTSSRPLRAGPRPLGCLRS